MSETHVSQKWWLSGELASSAGVSSDTLRHYERKGVLPKPIRASNGYRRYPEAALDRVLMIRRALAVGFTLDELAEIFREHERGEAPCRKVRDLAIEKLHEIDERVRILLDTRDQLRQMVADWDERLSRTPKNGRAGLLRRLPDIAANDGHARMKLGGTLKSNKWKVKK